MMTLAPIAVYIVSAALILLFSLSYARRREGMRFRALWTVLLSVFAAGFLFWLIESGICRLLLGFTALFTLMTEDGFLWGRTALLIVCLLLCLGLGLTERGERILAALKRAAGKNGVLWLFSLAVTALFFLWTARITVIRFMTNDDTSLMQTIAATAKTGLSAARSSFSNPLFCGLIGLFYRIDPEGFWYAGYHLVVLFSACLVTGRCILLKTRNLDISPLWGCLIAWLACMGVFLPAIAELSFTVTPAAAGTAACALLFCRDDESLTPAGRICSDVGTVVLILLCWLHRRASGQALLCFFGLACAYQLIRILRTKAPDRNRQLLGLVLTTAAALVLIGGCRLLSTSGAVAENDADYRDYWNAEYYRSIVMDFLNGQLTAEQLEAVGIPPELGNLLFKQWYFMDERINTDTFRTLTELYYTPAAETSGGSAGLLSSLAASYKDEPSYLPSLRALTAAGLLLALLCVVRFIRCGKDYWPEFLCGFCAIGGAGLLCLYVMLQGRMLFRVFLLSAMPALVLLLLCCLTGTKSTPSRARRAGTAIPTGLLAAALGALCVIAALHVPYASESASRDTVFEDQHKTEAYANEHPELYFVTNFASQNLDPFHGGTYPDNMHLWGGTGVTAMADEDRLFADAFFREDVRFMCELPGSVMLLLQYLTLDNGPVAALEEAKLTGNITVFDLDQLAPADGADGWYEWNGLRYCFRDGAALTGTQEIEGETYEFSPAGAASPMFVADTDAGRYYVTRAYALAE